MHRLVSASLFALAVAAAAPAHASDEDFDCGSAAAGDWLSADTISASVAEQGYDVRNVKREDRCYEVYALDQSGARVELYVNPVSGEIVHVATKS